MFKPTVPARQPMLCGIKLRTSEARTSPHRPGSSSSFCSTAVNDEPRQQTVQPRGPQRPMSGRCFIPRLPVDTFEKDVSRAESGIEVNQHARMHAATHSPTHTYARAHTHTHTRTHACAGAHTHAHTENIYEQSYELEPDPIFTITH